jgi:hypothetical protein
MALLRACADAFVRRRLLRDTPLVAEARRALAQAGACGSTAAIAAAERMLARVAKPLASRLRRRCDELASELFHSIGLQLSVKKYHALAWNRGAFLDTLDLPVSDAPWLATQLRQIRQVPDEDERQRRIAALLGREQAGPCGCYESFGRQGRKGRAVGMMGKDHDPGNLASPFIAHAVGLRHLSPAEQDQVGGIPLHWLSDIHTLYDTPLTLTYDGLDRRAHYRLRVTYLSYFLATGAIRLVANQRYLIHAGVRVKHRVLTREFDLPRRATASGRLTLTWTTTPGTMGVHLAELWLRQNAPAC